MSLNSIKVNLTRCVKKAFVFYTQNKKMSFAYDNNNANDAYAVLTRVKHTIFYHVCQNHHFHMTKWGHLMTFDVFGFVFGRYSWTFQNLITKPNISKIIIDMSILNDSNYKLEAHKSIKN